MEKNYQNVGIDAGGGNATERDVRECDSGGVERLLVAGAEDGDVAEGVDLDGPPDARAPQRRRDAGREAQGADAGREPAELEVPPHRDLHRLVLLAPLLVAVLGVGGGL